MRKFALAILILVVVFPALAADSNSPLSERYPDAKRVGDDVKAPVVIKRVAPHYPEKARRDNVTGTVILEALIDRNGDVKDAVVLKDVGYDLGDHALAALKKWKFKPATAEGEPVDVLFNLTINFKPAVYKR